MRENEFWEMVEKMRKKKTLNMRIGSFGVRSDCDPVSEYMHAHSILPGDYDCLTDDIIRDMGNLLLLNKCDIKTKKAIIMFLAHQSSNAALAILTLYSDIVEPGMKNFVSLGLEECIFNQEI